MLLTSLGVWLARTAINAERVAGKTADRFSAWQHWVHGWHELQSMLRGWLVKQLTASLHGSSSLGAWLARNSINVERVAGNTADRLSAHMTDNPPLALLNERAA